MTSDFDPRQHKPKQFDDALPAGIYWLVIEKLSLQYGKEKGTPYARCMYRVIEGPLAKRTMFSSLGVDIGNRDQNTRDAIRGRLSAFCDAADAKDPVSTKDEQSMQRAWMNRPFKAKVDRRERNGYVNNDIKLYYLRGELTDAEVTFAEEWRANFLAEQDFDGGGDAGGDDDFDDVPF